MPSKSKILVVEDEVAIRTGLIDVLVYNGYDVDYADNGTDGLAKALTGHYCLLLLDVMLPGIDGYEICQRVREQYQDLAIIMLTAKTSDDEIIHGLSLGADDYVSKPFSIRQLVLRIQAVLRRSQTRNEHPKIILGDTVTIDTLNLTGQCNHQEQVFTRREIDVLQYLQIHCDRPVNRDELLHKVWGYDKQAHIETRTVDIHIAKLRRKIEQDSKQPIYLVTIRGEGYRLLNSNSQ